MAILTGVRWYLIIVLICKVKWSRQSCPTLCDPMDCSLPGSSVHGIFQARTLEWVSISFSGGSSQPRDRTQVSCIVGRHFYHLSHQGSRSSLIISDVEYLFMCFFTWASSLVDPCFFKNQGFNVVRYTERPGSGNLYSNLWTSLLALWPVASGPLSCLGLSFFVFK